MPSCGSQIVLCDVPVHFDTYKGCTHACRYCFARRKGDIDTVGFADSPASLLAFVSGKRNAALSWCDWNIPLHWGALSDPFQPAEKVYRRSMACLEIFAQSQYPFMFSTKGRLVADKEYLDILAQCNVVGQVSIVSPKYDPLEPGAPKFTERLDIIEKLAPNVKRLIVRVQPYALGLVDSVLEALPEYKRRGVFGVVVEAMKRVKKSPGLVRLGGDWVYPVDKLSRDFERIKDKCHDLGMAFYSGENRLRRMGDSACCCGVEGVPGFIPNRANLNHMNDDGTIEYTDRMKQPGTGKSFAGIGQDPVGTRWTANAPYSEAMDLIKRSKTFLRLMGYLPEDSNQ